VTVRGDHRAEPSFEQRPTELFGLGPVTAEERRRVHLQRPASLCQLVRDGRIGEHRLGALRVGDDRTEPRLLDVLGERVEQIGWSGERDLHQDAVGAFEDVTVRILFEQRRCRRQLEAEAQLELRLRAHALIGSANLRLPFRTEREVRPDVRRREEDRRSVRGSTAAEGEAVRDRRCAVVTGWDDVRVTVDEATVHVL